MVIRRSSSADVQELIGELRASATDESRREVALARLAVIGKRAIRRILDALSTARTADEQIAFLLALERLPDERAVQPVLAMLEGSSNRTPPAPLAVRVAAVRAARPLLDLTTEGTAVLDRLTALILDSAENGELRWAALEALSDLPARAMKPLKRRLENDPDPALRAYAKSKGKPAADGSRRRIGTGRAHRA